MEPQPQNQPNVNTGKKERLESDAHRIVRRHLENKNDVITEDDLRNVRIGTATSEPEIIAIDGESIIGQQPASNDNEMKLQSDKMISPLDIIED